MAFSAAKIIHSVPISVPPGTNYCWLDTSSVDQVCPRIYTCLVLLELNPRPHDLGSSAVTTPPYAP